MTDGTPRQDDELFHACLDLPPEQREAWLLAQLPDDLSRRMKVLRLLRAHDRIAGRTLQPLVELTGEADPTPERIGPYAITGVLGEGGMGVVYEAEQTEPVRRRVALKILKAGMDTRQVVGRFLAERQALAAMDHPFIAKVLDAGQTPGGRPYFVMERVEGEPLLDYCERRALGVRARIHLIVMVCQAVQHAHQKGVIHRDLKPSNVLVVDGEAGPRPTVIDFGIAKAISEDARTPGKLTTLLEQRLGTPAYMSPEQAAGTDVDTRTDIYALGVILYELLTGRVPADPGQMGTAAFLQKLAAGEIDPPPPSAVASARRLSPDLDAIVMKAIAVERERRYDSAAALAEDLERYLRDDPVAARPPTTSYRVRKFVRRHRLGLAAASVAVLALVAGAIAAGIGLMRARAAEARARAEARESAEVTQFLTSLFSASDPNMRTTTTLRELLDRAAARVGSELAGQPHVQTTLFAKLAHVYYSLGVHKQAASLAEQALALQEGAGIENLETADALLTLGRSVWQLGDLKRAQGLLARARDIRARLDAGNAIGMAEVLNNLGGLHGQLEQYDQAMAAYERARALLQQPGVPSNPHLGVTHRGMAIIRSRQGQHEQAFDLSRRALEIFRDAYGDDHPVTAQVYEDLAFYLKNRQRYAEARSMAERALAIKQRVLGPEHPQTAFPHAILGDVHAAEDRLAEAREQYEAALRIREKALGPKNPRTADMLVALGTILERQGDAAGSRRALARAHDIYLEVYGPDHSRTQGAAKALAKVRDKKGARAVASAAK